mmetsp:Transcript_3357/g.7341  ORF Transcript_3357/g.7341 Transcript_3357/m.7341 type:complete len:538 (+) Transcript_3357:145-1758(+)
MGFLHASSLFSCLATWLTYAILVLQLVNQAHGVDGLPHVRDCYFCQKCHVGKEDAAEKATWTTARQLAAVVRDTMLVESDSAGFEDHAWDYSASNGDSSNSRQLLAPPELDVELKALYRRWAHGPENPGDAAAPYNDIYPTRDQIMKKRSKQNCTECWGCSTQLQPLKAIKAFGQDFSVETGASPEWIFTADLPGSVPGSGGVVIKVWCMPIDKVHGTFTWRCEKSDHATRANQFLLAQQKVMEECGLMDVTVKVWIAPVNAIVPGSGLHIWWNGLWMERAQGVSLNQLSYITRKMFVQQTIMELLQAKLNKTRVVRAAMYDLLTSQCDRHAQNVFINEHGNIRLIDNLQALKFNWFLCSADSIFLPGTQKNEVVRFGGDQVSKKHKARTRRSINPMLLLDYRCYAKEIGTSYPAQMQQCLKKLSGMSAPEVMKAYDFPLQRNAEVLLARAKDMLEKGFEWTLKHGEPANLRPKRYKWHEPCCKLAVDDHNTVTCGHPYNPVAEFPRGDPLRGGGWIRPYPDPGTYDGGTVFEDAAQ